jgi:hypothetical protein
MSDLETPEGFHARVAAATDAEGRLPVAIEAMPGWDIFPFELDGLLQLRGSTLLDWEENLPQVPQDVRRANAAHVGARLVERFGGDGPAWLA